jgi:hypothetical protein
MQVYSNLKLLLPVQRVGTIYGCKPQLADWGRGSDIITSRKHNGMVHGFQPF